MHGVCGIVSPPPLEAGRIVVAGSSHAPQPQAAACGSGEIMYTFSSSAGERSPVPPTIVAQERDLPIIDAPPP